MTNAALLYIAAMLAILVIGAGVTFALILDRFLGAVPR